MTCTQHHHRKEHSDERETGRALVGLPNERAGRSVSLPIWERVRGRLAGWLAGWLALVSHMHIDCCSRTFGSGSTCKSAGSCASKSVTVILLITSRTRFRSFLSLSIARPSNRCPYQHTHTYTHTHHTPHTCAHTVRQGNATHATHTQNSQAKQSSRKSVAGGHDSHGRWRTSSTAGSLNANECAIASVECCGKRISLLSASFPYVCPEPVWANRTCLSENGSKKGVSPYGGRPYRRDEEACQLIRAHL